MNLARDIKIRLVVFAVIAVAAAGIMAVRYVDLPAMLFGIGRYEVAVDLGRAGGLYPQSNVSYHGTTVGRVKSVELTDTGVRAVLSLDSNYSIPSQLRAEVHSQSAIGEQFVDLLPDPHSSAPPLKNGDVIAAADTAIPPDFDSLLDAANRGLTAIPQDNLKTAIDESYRAIGGLGPELTRLVKGGSELAIDSDRNIDSLLTLIDQSKPVLDSQVDSADSIKAWAAHVAEVTKQLAAHDTSVAGVLENGGAAAAQGRELFERLQPTLPVLLANLVGLGQVAVTYQPAIEQLLVLVPPRGGCRAGFDGRQSRHQIALQGPVPGFQPQPRPAARLQHRVPTAATTADFQRRRLSRPCSRGSVLPSTAGVAVQRARCPQLPLPDGARKTRPNGEDVRKR